MAKKIHATLPQKLEIIKLLEQTIEKQEDGTYVWKNGWGWSQVAGKIGGGINTNHVENVAHSMGMLIKYAKTTKETDKTLADLEARVARLERIIAASGFDE